MFIALQNCIFPNYKNMLYFPNKPFFKNIPGPYQLNLIGVEGWLKACLQDDALFMLDPTPAHPIDSSTNYLTKDLNDLYPVPHHTVAA